MISAFGVDHGEVEVSKLVNPMQALRAAGTGVKATVNPAGKRRAPGMSQMPGLAAKLRTFTGGAGASMAGGMKRAGAAISGNPGKRAAPTMRTRVGGAVTGAGQRAFSNPYRTGAVGLGAAGGGTAAAGAGGAMAYNRKKRPGQV